MKTAEEILKERGSVYGPFDKLSEISQGIERLIIGGSKRTRFTAVQREAIKMVSSKLARLACGDPNHLDSWLDASNYLKLAHDDTLKKAKDWREAGEESLLLQCSPSGRCTASKANVVLAGGPGGRSNSIAAALGPASLDEKAMKEDEELYKKADLPAGMHVEPCPVCRADAELWQYSTDFKNGPIDKVVMCSNGDRFGPQDGAMNEGCLLYMPPPDFYRGRIVEAVTFWNEYAKALNAQRREREKPRDYYAD